MDIFVYSQVVTAGNVHSSCAKYFNSYLSVFDQYIPYGNNQLMEMKTVIFRPTGYPKWKEIKKKQLNNITILPM